MKHRDLDLTLNRRKVLTQLSCLSAASATSGLGLNEANSQSQSVHEFTPKDATITKSFLNGGAIYGLKYRSIRRFLGIAYAYAPTAALRFMPPQPPEPIKGAFKAFEYANDAPQGDGLDNKILNEDCLKLNIWAPENARAAPIYVWIHGGGNAGGSANMEPRNGEAFAQNGIIFVSLSYRIGVLGFLELGEILGAPYLGSSNNGLKDQIMALWWVFNNIKAFGGDPHKITIGGHSAGAKNVSALISVAHLRPPISGAILHSGGGHTTHSLKDAQDITKLFLQVSDIKKPKDILIRDLRSLLLA